MGLDIKNFYLGTPLDRYEYMKVPLHIFPQHIIDQYALTLKEKGGFIYLEIGKVIMAYLLLDALQINNYGSVYC